MLLQQILYKIWKIEYTIASVVSLDCHTLTLSLTLKGGSCLDSFSIFYRHLVVDDHITTGMVNKNTSNREHFRWIRIYLCVVKPTWILKYIMICRQQMSIQKIILIFILILYSILLGCLYFMGLTMALSKIIGKKIGTFTVGNWLVVSLHLQTPFENEPFANFGTQYVPV